MEICITGGSGFVGRSLTRHLQSTGHRVCWVGRRRRTPDPTAPVPDDSREVDFFNARQLETAFAGAGAVIHLVGIIREFREATFERVHVGLTDRVVAACEAAGIPRLVHMSALGTRPDARSRYHRTKWLAEQRVRAGKSPWTIFRPSLIYGPEDAFTTLFAGLARWLPVIPVMGGGRNLMQPIGVAAVATAFAGALGAAAAIGQTLDLCGPERLTFAAILRAVLAGAGRRRLLVPVPMPLARVQARCLEVLFPCVLGRPTPLNRDQLVMLEEPNVGDGTLADALFGLRHPPFAVAMREQFPS